jgi:hypothetical protein
VEWVMLKSILTGLAFVVFTTIAAKSEDMTLPKGEVVLSFAGAIENKNSKATANFDLDMLKALPITNFKTTTTWTDGETAFTGVSLKAILAVVGSSGTNLHSIALNDYAVDVPASDAVDDGPIIAYFMNGKPMSPRDKGPLWLVYPFDSKAAYKTEEIYSRAIWQLSKIEVQK